MSDPIAVVGLACKGEIGFEKTGDLCRATVGALAARNISVVDTGIIMHDSATAKEAAQALEQLDFSVLMLCVGTWSEDNHLLELLPTLQRSGKSVILHAYPAVDTGSLCGVHQITSVFTDVGFTSFQYVYGDAGSDAATEQILQILAGLQAAAPAQKDDVIYIGAIGGRVPGMTEISFDEFSLYEKCGAVIIPISETELLDEVAAVDPAQLDAEVEKVLSRGFKVSSTGEAVRESVQFYLAMKVLVARYRLTGLAVKCYTRYMGKVCLGYSLLSDEGIVCSCEGDVSNTVMMRIMANITGQCVNHTDLLYPNVENNTILFAHCGSSGFSIAPSAQEVELAPVRLQDRGVCSLFIPKTGLVTLADLVGHGDKLRMSVMVGEAVETPMTFPGNPALVKFKLPVLELCRRIAQMGCGHHWMVGYGDVSAELEAYCRERGVIYQRVDA